MVQGRELRRPCVRPEEKVSTDQQFIEKVRHVVFLYLDPPVSVVKSFGPTNRHEFGPLSLGRAGPVGFGSGACVPGGPATAEGARSGDLR